LSAALPLDVAPRAATLELLGRLIGFDTVSHRSNLALIEFVRGYLAEHGIESHLVHDATGAKANLYATIGPRGPGGIVLSGHSDVVPVEGQPWTSDPFTLTAREGKLYGRGTSDMKGFIAVALALVPEFKRRALKKPIHLCFSHDEEVGCIGIPSLVRQLGRDLPQPAIAIIGEPTMMRVASAHKGITALATTVRGRDGHSSRPDRGANAILFMGRVLGAIERLYARLRAQGAPTLPGVEFEPPWTTVGVGTIAGGTAINIIAREARIAWEFRQLPGTDAAAILRDFESEVAPIRSELKQAAPDGDIVTEVMLGAPALRPEPDGVAEALALRLTGANRTIAVSYGTEGGHFQQHGISTVVCGPGDIAQAHQPNEFIAPHQLGACEVFLQRLADWAAT
jgi:acetylornithine deacetylase